MVIRVALAGVVLGLVGCGARSHGGPASRGGHELTLYRSHTLVKQRVELEVPVGKVATIKVPIAAGTNLADVAVLDPGGLTISQLGAREAPPDTSADEAPDAAGPSAPPELTMVVRAPRAGRYVLHLGYVTERIDWSAAYTVTTTPARRAVTLRGAIAIRNTAGVAFRGARVFVIDAELGAWRGRMAERLGSALAGSTASTTPFATPRALGRLDVAGGESRIDLVPGDRPRPLRSVLVFDPIGTDLDRPGAVPSHDATLGAEPLTTARVHESFEIARHREADVGLPGGPVRIFERRADGGLVVLAEARLFDAASRIAEEDTVAIGTADGITGRRERRELTIDDDGKRVVEEFVLTIANLRGRPVEVVLREHLYRGQNWTLAYQTASAPRKEGPQQISLRTVVPAHGEAKVLYVVVYTWP